MDHSSYETADHHSGGQYARLVAMTVLAFIAMYVLMYSMVNSPSNIFANINQVYMAGLMVAPMVVIELVLMSAMYQRRGWNAAIIVASVVIGLAMFIGIRRQLIVADKQFSRSMIPHHASAILMCRPRNPARPRLSGSRPRAQPREAGRCLRAHRHRIVVDDVSGACEGAL